MNKEEQRQDTTNEQRPLVFYLELLRQNYGERGMSQGELADLLGISPALLRRYEQMRQVPKVIEHLVGAAYILGARTLEALIAPGLLEELYSRLDERLESRGRPPRRPIGFADGKSH
jgi:transcriptional regulator with XRE-family HTH domain